MNNCIVAVVRNIKIPCTFEKTLVLDARAIQVAIKHCNKLGVISCLDKELAYVYKKSIDARDKNKIHLVYSIAIPIIRNFSDSIRGVQVAVNKSLLEELRTLNEKSSISHLSRDVACELMSAKGLLDLAIMGFSKNDVQMGVHAAILNARESIAVVLEVSEKGEIVEE